jgi:hypothetical protein
MSCDKKLIPIHFITQAEVKTIPPHLCLELIIPPFPPQAGPRREDNAKLVGCLLHGGRLDGELKEELISFMRISASPGRTPKASQKTIVGGANARRMAELLSQKNVSRLHTPDI